MSRFIVETNDGLIDISGCRIRIHPKGPSTPFDPPDRLYNLYAVDLFTETKVVLAQSKDQKSIASAYEKIKTALKNNESYVDIRKCESEDRNTVPIDPNPGQTKRRPPKHLRITQKDGTVIQHKSQRKTFFEAIEAAGIERVHALRLGSLRHPLVERKNTDEPPGEYRHSDTSGFYSLYGAYHAKKKESLLNTISTRLGLQWNVEVSDSVEMEAD